MKNTEIAYCEKPQCSSYQYMDRDPEKLGDYRKNATFPST